MSSILWEVEVQKGGGFSAAVPTDKFIYEVVWAVCRLILFGTKILLRALNELVGKGAVAWRQPRCRFAALIINPPTPETSIETWNFEPQLYACQIWLHWLIRDYRAVIFTGKLRRGRSWPVWWEAGTLRHSDVLSRFLCQYYILCGISQRSNHPSTDMLNISIQNWRSFSKSAPWKPERTSLLLATWVTFFSFFFSQLSRKFFCIFLLRVYVFFFHCA